MPRLLLLILAAVLAFPAGALARAGTLEARFGTSGVELLGRAGANLSGSAVATLGDGRSIAAGSDGRGFLVARLRASGAPDPSFGRHGSVIVRFRGASRAGARAIALFRDGRIIVAGTVTIGGVRRVGV